MKRALLIAALVAATSTVLVLATLFGLRDYLRPVFVNGDATTHRIDREAAAMIAARFPQVPVGAARCPALLNLTGARRGHCTLRIGAADLRIDVAHLILDFNSLEPVDALFVTSDGQRSIADALAETYGEPFSVRCPGPPIRILPPATTLTCVIQAPDVPRRELAVTPVGYEGDFRIDELRGVTKRMARAFGATTAAQRTGSVALAGSAVERYVALNAAFEARGEIGRRHLVGAAHCPPRIVLRNRDRATCTVRIAGQVQRFYVAFDRRIGLNVWTDVQPEVVPVLREIATRYLERTHSSGGRRARAHVDCGPATITFVDTESMLKCTATIAGRRIRFTIEIDDAEHLFAIHADD